MKKRCLPLAMCLLLVMALFPALTVSAGAEYAEGVIFKNTDDSTMLVLSDGQYLHLEEGAYVANGEPEGALAHFAAGDAGSNGEPATLLLSGDVPGFAFEGDMTIKLSANVTTGQYGGMSGDNSFQFSIRGNGNFAIDAGAYTLTAASADVENENGNAFSAAISNKNTSATMTIVSGTVVATGGAAKGAYCASYGLNSYGDLSIEGGTVRARGGDASGADSSSFGIRSGGVTTVSGGTVTARSGRANVRSAFDKAPVLTGGYENGGSAVRTGSADPVDFAARPGAEHFAQPCVQIAPYTQGVTFRAADATNILTLKDGEYLHKSGDTYVATRAAAGSLAHFAAAKAGGSPVPATLTLSGDVPGFMFTGDLTIRLAADSSVSNYSSSSAENDFSFCIRATGNMTLELEGHTLSARSGDVNNADGNAFSAAVSNSDTDKLIIMRSGTLDTRGGDVSAAYYTASYGLNSYGRLLLEGGTILAGAGTAEAGMNAGSYGIRSGVSTTVTGGTITSAAGAAVCDTFAESRAFDKAPALLGGLARGELTLLAGSAAPGEAAEPYSGEHFLAPYVKMTPAASGEWTSPYADVERGDWFYDSVRYVTVNGLMDGVAANAFAPEGVTTRAMAVTILHRMEGAPAAAGAPDYTDVADGLWYSEAVAWASSNGLVDGYADGSYRPDAPISREELALILFRCAEYRQGSRPEASEGALAFADGDEVSDWAVDAVRWAAELGIVTGDADGLLRPRGEASRAQLAVMLMRYLERT